MGNNEVIIKHCFTYKVLLFYKSCVGKESLQLHLITSLL